MIAYGLSMWEEQKENGKMKGRQALFDTTEMFLDQSGAHETGQCYKCTIEDANGSV